MFYLPLSLHCRPLGGLTLLLFFLVRTGLAQPAEFFDPGTITLSDGTELSGRIYYDNWVQTPAAIQFMPAGGSASQTYVPAELSGFVVNDLRYRTDTVTLTPDIADVSGVRPQLVFLREAITGAVSLYSHVGAKDKLHLFIDTGTGPIELVKRNYRSREGYQYKSVTDEKFRGQLKYYLRACPALSNRIDRLRYTQSNAVDLLVDYHECIGSAPTVWYTPSELRVDWIPIIGLTHTRLAYNSDLLQFQGTDFPGQTGLSLGFGLDAEIASRFRAVSLYSELHFQRNTFEDSYSVIDTSGLVAIRQQAQLSQLRTNIGLRANLLRRSDVLFLSAGVSNVFYVQRDLRQEVTAPDFPDGEPFPLRGFGFGFHFDLGARVGDFRFWLRYGLDNGVSNSGVVSSPMQYYRFLAGYAL